MNHDIFISYSSKQKSIADGVCHYLEENGFKCWMAPRDIPVGSDYGDLIEEAIKTCKVVVLVFSEAASISKWIKGEINVAFTDDKPILPFRVDETEVKGGFRVMLNQMHWIDAFPQFADKLPDLLKSVCGFLGRKPQKVSNESERLEAERKAKEDAEAERKRKEEEERRKAEEEAERVRLEKERLEKIEADRKAKETAEKERLEYEKNAEQVRKISPKQAIINGHEYVDLGLPSGTLWATCNVGADKPEDDGYHFAWEEGKKAATNWGVGWQLPSKEQWEELLSNTKKSSIKIKRNGWKQNCTLFRASNGHTILLPSAGYFYENELFMPYQYGYYWSGSLGPNSDYQSTAWRLYFDLEHCYITSFDCSFGLSVRLVRFAK